MDSRIIRMRELVERLGLSQATIYRAIVAGTFPRAVKLGKRARGWRSDDVQQWIDDREQN